MIKRLIFDVDGTIINIQGFNAPVEKTLKRLGIYSEDNFNKFLRAMKEYEEKYDAYKKDNYISTFSNELGVELDDSFIKIFFEELENFVPPKNTKLIDKIEELSKKYELVILTNYFKKSQMDRLNKMEIR